MYNFILVHSSRPVGSAQLRKPSSIASGVQLSRDAQTLCKD